MVKIQYYSFGYKASEEVVVVGFVGGFVVILSAETEKSCTKQT